MGCEFSNEQKMEYISQQSSEDNWSVTYRELITQDRGRVFELYHFSMIISRSEYSIVRKVQSRNSLINRICKIIPLSNRKTLDLLSEVEFLKKMDHPNIIKIIQYFFEPSFLYIIFEEVQGNCILQELHKCVQWITFDHILEIMRQILSAVEYCHKNSIAHRAISADNVMLAWTEKTPVLKLIDFSQAQAIDCSKYKKILPSKRTIFINEDELSYPDKIDILDCGMLFFEIFMGKKNKIRNFQLNHPKIMEEIDQVINQLGLNEETTYNLRQIFPYMMNPNPKKRSEASSILNMPMFKLCKSKNDQVSLVLKNLLNFKGQNNVRYLLQMYASLNMASNLEKTQYLTQFFNLDQNRDGEIQLEELIEGIKNTFGISEEKAEKKAKLMFEQLDKNNSGSLNFSEYVVGTMKLSKVFSSQLLKKMFKEIDLNHNGKISESQFNNLISGIDRYQILGKKKEINFEEFQQIMMKILDENSNKQNQDLQFKSGNTIRTLKQNEERKSHNKIKDVKEPSFKDLLM